MGVLGYSKGSINDRASFSRPQHHLFLGTGRSTPWSEVTLFGELWLPEHRILSRQLMALLSPHCSLFTSHFSLHPSHFSSLTTPHCPLITIHYYLLVAHFSFLVTHFSIFILRCSPPTTSRSSLFFFLIINPHCITPTHSLPLTFNCWFFIIHTSAERCSQSSILNSLPYPYSSPLTLHH